MSKLRLAELHCYPLKSARGEALQHADMDDFGLHGDRRWMLVDEEGVFVSQRSTPVLALLGVRTTGTGLALSFAGDAIEVEKPDSAAQRRDVQVWADTVSASLADAAVNDWLSRKLEQPLRLVYLPDEAQRRVDPNYAKGGERVAFSDGFPLLLATQASLDDLNARMGNPVPMNRFRPNLVIEGAEPFAEDGWSRVQIGEVMVDLVKPCSRCAVPSVIQETAQRDGEINRVLASFRRRDGAIYFGMNALAPAGAQFRVGDSVAVFH